MVSNQRAALLYLKLQYRIVAAVDEELSLEQKPLKQCLV